jgi:hypothetical protein
MMLKLSAAYPCAVARECFRTSCAAGDSPESVGPVRCHFGNDQKKYSSPAGRDGAPPGM